MQTRHRRLLLRLALYVLCLLVLPLAALWVYVAQPSWRHHARTRMAVDAARLERHVRTLSQKLAPRAWSDHTNLTLCAAYIQREFADSGACASNQLYVFNKQTYANVVATFPGRSEARIIVGAHYDACGPLPGADDNASGVAGLIELARLLAHTNLTCTVELVAYCTEEPPFFATSAMGSAQHAKQTHRQGTLVRAVVVLEMIGYFRDERGSQHFPFQALQLFYPSRGNFLAVVGATGERQRALLREIKGAMRGSTDLPIYSISVPRSVPGVDFSDHRNYWEFGYPAVMLTDTAFFRNPAYHRADDTPDRLDYVRMAHAVEALYEAVVDRASDSPSR